VILVSEATTRPPEVRYFDFAQRVNNVGADPARVGDRRVFFHEKSSINTSAKVLGKMTVNMAADHMLGQLRAGNDPVIGRLSTEISGKQEQKNESTSEEIHGLGSG
jgi:hypothetical protein